MKTRIWKVEIELADLPEYDDEGVPYPYLRKAQRELEKLDLPAFLSLKLISIKMVGHRDDSQ